MVITMKLVKTEDKLPISYPSEGAAGKTGTWRLERPIVNNEMCTRCYLCEIYCPGNVITVDKEGAHIDYNYCKGCGICVKVCPKNAIKMEPEEE